MEIVEESKEDGAPAVAIDGRLGSFPEPVSFGFGHELGTWMSGTYMLLYHSEHGRSIRKEV